MLSPTLASVRVFLHILAASVWVGGQIVVAGVVPGLRRAGGSDGTRALAVGFARVAWPAYVLALLTGIWMLLDRPSQTTAYDLTFGVKFLFFVAAGGAAVAHARSDRRIVVAVAGGLGLVFSLAVMFLGTLLAHQS